MRLKEENKEKEKAFNNKKTITKNVKKMSKSKESEDFEINNEADYISKDKLSNKSKENEELIILEKNDEIEITDEIKNARKKRRRSSAGIE